MKICGCFSVGRPTTFINKIKEKKSGPASRAREAGLRRRQRVQEAVHHGLPLLLPALGVPTPGHCLVLPNPSLATVELLLFAWILTHSSHGLCYGLNCVPLKIPVVKPRRGCIWR